MMTSFPWTGDQQIAFWLSLMSGAMLGDAMGYFAHLSASGIWTYSFVSWVLCFGVWWQGLGAGMGAGTAYLLWKFQ